MTSPSRAPSTYCSSKTSPFHSEVILTLPLVSPMYIGLASLDSMFTEVKIFLGEAQINASWELASESLPIYLRVGAYYVKLDL